MVLDGSLKSLEVVLAGGVATAQPVFYAAYADHTLTTFVPGASDGLTNGATAVTAVAAPTSGIQRQIKLFSLFNNDTAVVTATVRINNNAVMRIVVKITLAIGDTLEYDPSNGWKVITAAGVVKSGISPAGATGEIQYNAGGGSLGASPNLAWSIANNQLLLGDGTPANPSYSFVSDPDTGVYRAAVNVLGLLAGGVDIARLYGAVATRPALLVGGLTAPTEDFAGFAIVEVRGPTAAGLLFMSTAAADADGVQLGQFMFKDRNATGDKTAARWVAQLQGATANNRGGMLIASTKRNAGAIIDCFVLDNKQNQVLGEQAALATTVTDGFTYIPTMAGTPTGTPTAFTGKVAIVFDTTGNKLWVYDGAWIGIVLA